MSEETRYLKEILNNQVIENYGIDDDECYLNGYARKCLKKVLEENERLHSIIEEARQYVEDEDIDVCTIRYNDIQDVKQELLEILDKVEEK